MIPAPYIRTKLLKRLCGRSDGAQRSPWTL